MPDGRCCKSLTHHDSRTGCCCQPEDGARVQTSRANSSPASGSCTDVHPRSYPSWEAQAWVNGISSWERYATTFYFGDGFSRRLEPRPGALAGLLHPCDEPRWRLIPFCAYNLTDSSGTPLYRNGTPNNIVRLTPLEPWIQTKIGAQPGAVLLRSDLESYQLERFRQTIRLGREKSRFYAVDWQNAPGELSRLEDLALFPFTTPEDLRRKGSNSCASRRVISTVWSQWIHPVRLAAQANLLHPLRSGTDHRFFPSRDVHLHQGWRSGDDLAAVRKARQRG